jgi:hypothetical protein
MIEQQTLNNHLNANGVYGVLPVRAFFVGMHNKPGMEPLDSRTMTGKVIDLIAKRLDQCQCIKTNLCDVDYFPKDIVEINKMALEWHKKYQPTQGDIIVLLGGWVKKHFWYDNLNVVSITHPAGVYGPTNKKEYITKSVVKIVLQIGGRFNAANVLL